MSKLLDEYRRKRSADRTPEPMGAGAARPGVFVVQKHSASRMHYDLRLEGDGVVKSWAVRRGPHPDPAEKRLAMQTEDHPVEYADFEGVIPEGEYGAGPMIVWDRGLWRPVGDPGEGVKGGKLLFELKGFKLKGMWTLVRIKGETGKEWLLIKETGDGHVRRGVREPYDDSSILSGLPVEDLHERGKRDAGPPGECRRVKGGRRGGSSSICARSTSSIPGRCPCSSARSSSRAWFRRWDRSARSTTWKAKAARCTPASAS